MIKPEERIGHVLAALSRAEVRYLVVGGVAVVLHGHLRTTLDLDLVVSLQSANLDRALSVLTELGFVPLAPVPMNAFADPANRASWARDRNMTVFSLWHPRHQGLAIDLFVQEPFDFESTYLRAATIELKEEKVTVIGLNDLIKMKEASRRDQDLLDLQALADIAASAESSGESR